MEGLGGSTEGHIERAPEIKYRLHDDYPHILSFLWCFGPVPQYVATNRILCKGRHSLGQKESLHGHLAIVATALLWYYSSYSITFLLLCGLSSNWMEIWLIRKINAWRWCPYGVTWLAWGMFSTVDLQTQIDGKPDIGYKYITAFRSLTLILASANSLDNHGGRMDVHW